jgi:SPP1 gp7 family putative phage head morphogenesis protein
MSNTYWGERAANAQAALTKKSIAQTEAQLKKYYQQTMLKILGEFEKTYLKIFQRITEGKEATPADLYKLDSYWQMVAQTRRELEKLGEKEIALLSKNFSKQFQAIYDSLALPAGDMFGTLDKETVTQMINQIWCADGKSWSQRIWTNTEKLQQALNDNLIHCVTTGAKPAELKHLLQKDFGVSFSRADSVVRTEMAHIQTQAAKKRYSDYGIEEVQIWADEDERRCEICGELHEKKYLINEVVPIPAHPRCRCCIIPVVN